MPDEIIRDITGRMLGRIYQMGSDRFLRDANGRLLGREDSHGLTRDGNGRPVGHHMLETLLNRDSDD